MAHSGAQRAVLKISALKLGSVVALSGCFLAMLGDGAVWAQEIVDDRPGAQPMISPDTGNSQPKTDSAPVPNSADVEAALAARDRQASQRLRLAVGDRVFFAPDSSELGSKAGLAIFGQANWLVGTGSKAVIVGHADDGGSAQDNLVIGLRRAEAVQQRLIRDGVPPDRLRVVSAGKTQPIAICDEPYCRVHNRRAVTVIVRRFAPVAAP